MHLDKFMTQNGKLYKQDINGDLYVWTPTNTTGLGEFGGLWKKLKKAAKKPFKVLTKSKIGRTIVRAAGLVAAPFTGGLSLAAAEAAARYGKARYGQGLSVSQARKGALIGAAIGYIGGRAASAGYSAFTKPAAVIGNVPGSGYLVPASTYSGTVAAAATPTTGLMAQIGAGLKSAASGIMSFGKTAAGLLPVAQSLMKPKGGDGQSFDSSMMAAGVPYAGDPGYLETGTPGGGGGGGGGMMPPEIDPETGAPIAPAVSPLMLGGIAAGLLLFTTMNGGSRRSRSRSRKRR